MSANKPKTDMKEVYEEDPVREDGTRPITYYIKGKLGIRIGKLCGDFAEDLTRPEIREIIGFCAEGEKSMVVYLISVKGSSSFIKEELIELLRQLNDRDRLSLIPYYYAILNAREEYAEDQTVKEPISLTESPYAQAFRYVEDQMSNAPYPEEVNPRSL